MAKASGGQHQESFVDVCAAIMQMLTQAKMLPDAPAHMQLIQALEKAVMDIIQALRSQQRQQAIQGGQGGPQQPGGGGGMPMGGGGPGQPGQPNQTAPGGGPGMTGFGTPNPDELRRVLAGPAAVGGNS